MVFYVVGRGGPLTTTSANEPLGALWNPSGTRRIRIAAISCFIGDFMSTPGDRLLISRISARGTPGSTVTLDEDSAGDGSSAPPSGAVLDLAEYTVLPTLLPPPLLPPFTPQGGSGGEGGGFYVPFPRGLTVPPGAGVCIHMTVGENMGGQWETSFEFED